MTEVQNSNKISITPASLMLQWWEYHPEYTLRELWNKSPIILDITEVKSIYKRAGIYIFEIEGPLGHYPLYLPFFPKALEERPVSELSAMETLKFLKKFKSKSKKFAWRWLALLFVVILMVRFYMFMHITG